MPMLISHQITPPGRISLVTVKQRQIEERQAVRRDREQKDKNFTKEKKIKRRLKEDKKMLNLKQFCVEQQQSLTI